MARIKKALTVTGGDLARTSFLCGRDGGECGQGRARITGSPAAQLHPNTLLSPAPVSGHLGLVCPHHLSTAQAGDALARAQPREPTNASGGLTFSSSRQEEGGAKPAIPSTVGCSCRASPAQPWAPDRRVLRSFGR